MSQAPTNAVTNSDLPLTTTYRPLRVWPTGLLLLGMVVARFVPPLIEDGPAMLWMVAAFGPLLCSVLLIIWWLAISRARWQERLLGLLGIVAAAVVTLLLDHKSMRGPAITIITVPMGLASFAIGAIVCSRMQSWRRTLIAVAFAACGFSFSLLLRADGIWGDFGLGLHWRWQPSAEERLLATRSGTPLPRAREFSDQELDEALLHPAWAEFRGDDRSGRQRGTLLATDWVKNPPEQIWKIPVGPAWSSFAVAGDLLFTQEQRGAMETVVCYDRQTGREVWMEQLESRFDDPLGGPGPRATPTLAEGNLFVMGAQGFLLRLDPRTGQVAWKQDLRQVAGRAPPMWGFSSSPLVENGVVIVYAGGAGDKGVLAFDVETGERKWSAASGEQSYSSPHRCLIAGEKLVAMLSNTGLTLLDPDTGKVRLNYQWPVDQYRVLQPQLVAVDSILVPTGMGSGTRRVQIKKSRDSLTTEDLWTSRNLKPDFNDFVVYQGHLYGFDAAILTCIDLETGDRRWRGGRYGKGQVLLLEDAGLLLVASELGDVVLVKADPSAHVELAKFKAIEGKTWNHPVVVGDRLYIRNAEEAACYRLPLAEAPQPAR